MWMILQHASPEQNQCDCFVRVRRMSKLYSIWAFDNYVLIQRGRLTPPDIPSGAERVTKCTLIRDFKYDPLNEFVSSRASKFAHYLDVIEQQRIRASRRCIHKIPTAVISAVARRTESCGHLPLTLTFT